eukprot:TRINITY_DN10047_c0_g1_i1.p1 TRINITY_DN10047_c0_g1~~TRINITY_DN10047_c0_g1_i1.p1  ORF type:complete len:537 (+),score=100.91 TRINITY_DN10047_c0_g1_i1:94-1704(+)
MSRAVHGLDRWDSIATSLATSPSCPTLLAHHLPSTPAAPAALPVRVRTTRSSGGGWAEPRPGDPTYGALARIPRECIARIFEQLRGRDLFAATLISREWRLSAAQEDSGIAQHFWRRRVREQRRTCELIAGPQGLRPVLASCPPDLRTMSAPELYRHWTHLRRAHWAARVRRDADAEHTEVLRGHPRLAVSAKRLGTTGAVLALSLPGVAYVQLVVCGVQGSLTAADGPWLLWLLPVELHLGLLALVSTVQAVLAAIALCHGRGVGATLWRHLAVEATNSDALRRPSLPLPPASPGRVPLLTPRGSAEGPQRVLLRSGDAWALRLIAVTLSITITCSAARADGLLGGRYAACAAPTVGAAVAYAALLACAAAARRCQWHPPPLSPPLLIDSTGSWVSSFDSHWGARRGAASLLGAAALLLPALQGDGRLPGGWLAAFAPLMLLVVLGFTAVAAYARPWPAALPVVAVAGAAAGCMLIFLVLGGLTLDGRTGLEAPQVFLPVWVVPAALFYCLLSLCVCDEYCCGRRVLRHWTSVHV